MIKIATKFNEAGNRKELIIDTINHTIKAGHFLFHVADIKDVTNKQFAAIIEAFKAAGFAEVE